MQNTSFPCLNSVRFGLRSLLEQLPRISSEQKAGAMTGRGDDLGSTRE